MKITHKAPLKKQESLQPFDFFMLAITMLSLVNLVFYLFLHDSSLTLVITFVDFILSLLFLSDFIRLYTTAPHKARYFFKEYGWADLLASLPFPQLNILKIFRFIKAYGMIRRAGWQAIKNTFSKDRASVAIYVVLFVIILLLEFGSVGILAIEGSNPNGNIKTASDAMWWVYVTITTVGYGDRFPVSNEGRILGAFVMLVGVGLFGVVTGFLANKFLPTSGGSTGESVALNKEASLKELHEEVRELRALLEKSQKASHVKPDTIDT